MSELIDREALKAYVNSLSTHPLNEWDTWGVLAAIDKQPTIDAVPIKFIDEVIEYLTKCRNNAIHEETKCAWDEQRQTLIMLLHEWAAWNECGRTGKYGERRANDEAD